MDTFNKLSYVGGRKGMNHVLDGVESKTPLPKFAF